MLAGALAGLAAIIAVSRNGAAGTLTGGGTQMLEAIAAAVIGGTSLFGGEVEFGRPCSADSSLSASPTVSTCWGTRPM